MNVFAKQNYLKGLILIIVITGLIGGNFYLRSKFHSGECVQALDGYIWHVNNYSFGKYTVMGWQSNAWGNEVVMEKSVLERKDTDIPVYHRIACPEYTTVENTEVEQAVPQAPQKLETKSTTPSRVVSQIKVFDDYLEYSLVGAQVDCSVYATYNNVSTSGQMDAQSFQQAFPDSKESYETRCRSAYLDVTMNQKILIAEPELQSLRVLLTSYAEEVKAFSQYALDGGSQASYIDSADKKMDNLRTLSREELLKLKGRYKLN